MLLSEELTLPLIQELYISGTWSGWTLTLKSSSCSCANTSTLASKGKKTMLLGTNEDQAVLFNGSVHLCQTKAQPSCGFKWWWKHSPVTGIEACLTQLEGLGLSKGSGTLKASTAQSSQCRKLLNPPPHWCHQSRRQQANTDSMCHYENHILKFPQFHMYSITKLNRRETGESKGIQ